ncbi:hypothetical protein Droror1_Dr00011922 [Drosera rotundifolia]
MMAGTDLTWEAGTLGVGDWDGGVAASRDWPTGSGRDCYGARAGCVKESQLPLSPFHMTPPDPSKKLTFADGLVNCNQHVVFC